MTDEKKMAARYLDACHAVQSGVAFDQARGSDDGSPKHLRTGVNLCKVGERLLRAAATGEA
jgi:hypothetical protein